MTAINLRVHVKQHPHVGRMRKRQRVLQLKNLQHNRATELWYKTELLKVVKVITTRTEEVLKPLLQKLSYQWSKDSVAYDGYKADLEQTFDDLASSFGGLRQTAQRLAKLAAERCAEHVDESLKEALKQSVGVDITGALTSEALAAPMESALVANVELIKSIPTKYLDSVKSRVYESTSEGLRWEDIVEKIQDIGSVTESRAKLIARDQVSKMNGSFNEARQTSLGIDKYIWQTSGDERVRDTHADNDGKVFNWDDPPATGHPGEDINCRCVALPYFNLDEEEQNLGI